MTATLNLKKWGNSLGVRLPAKIAREAKLETDMLVDIRVENGKVIIEPAANKNLSLEQRLELFNPEIHGGEAMETAENLGAEQW